MKNFRLLKVNLILIFFCMTTGLTGKTLAYCADRNGWFPHISPDNKKIVFIVYRAGDVAPGDHPTANSLHLFHTSNKTKYNNENEKGLCQWLLRYAP